MQCSIDVLGVKGLWLEIAIVADHTMTKFHGRERVKHYILAIMNIVSMKRCGELHSGNVYFNPTFACVETY